MNATLIQKQQIMWSTTIPYTDVMSIEGEVNVNNDDNNDNDDDVTLLTLMIRVVMA